MRLGVSDKSYMFPDVEPCFPVSPAALRQQVEDRCQFLFDFIPLVKRREKKHL